MARIKTIYMISHAHTDIGYTDHQTALFRQHPEFIDRAIELCEATADYPPEAQYKWTCEVTGMVERFVQTRPAAQVERLVRLNLAGRIAIAGMGYNWTPLLSPAAMVRSLFPVLHLRRDYGLRITSAMQCDVNGASWLWADMLPAIGINGLNFSINTHRGRRPRPVSNAFWWEGPGGGRVLAFNGPHYCLGVLFYGMGDLAGALTSLPEVVKRYEARPDYPYDFLYIQATNPFLPDNGGPYGALADFVRDWNASGREPRIVFTTVDGFFAMLHEHAAGAAPTWRGDWTDWWADGVASSAYETSIARTTEALLPALDMLATQANSIDPLLVEQAYQSLALYGEHSWGAYNSVTQPHHPIVHAQFNHKAGYAYNGYALTHELLARGGRQFSRAAGQVPEGDFENLIPIFREGADAVSSKERYLVINSLGWTRSLYSPIPPDSGGEAPYHFLNADFIPNYRDKYPHSIGRQEPIKDRAEVLETDLPPFSYQFVLPSLPFSPDDSGLGDGWIENRWYRIEIDPRSGGLRSWYDKELGRELAAADRLWQIGQYIYESVESPKERQAIFAEDFSTECFGNWVTNPPFRRQAARQVMIAPAQKTNLGEEIEVFLQAPGAHSVRLRYSLPCHQKALHLDMVIDKEYVTRPESIYVMFPFALEQPTFHLDLNGVPLTPDAEQLPGSCRDWYGIQRWAEVGDRQTSIVLVPMDAPLVQVGGIQTGRQAEQLDAREATLASWPVQNHWTTNFQAGQNGELLFRYRLTSLGAYDPAAASRFAAEYLTPPIIVRTYGDSVSAGQFMTVSPEGVADVHMKVAEDGRGLIIRAFNLTATHQKLRFQFPLGHIQSAFACSPIEDDSVVLPVQDDALELAVPPRTLAQARVLFQP